jgi:hypothetical protein
MSYLAPLVTTHVRAQISRTVNAVLLNQLLYSQLHIFHGTVEFAVIQVFESHHVYLVHFWGCSAVFRLFGVT